MTDERLDFLDEALRSGRATPETLDRVMAVVRYAREVSDHGTVVWLAGYLPDNLPSLAVLDAAIDAERTREGMTTNSVNTAGVCSRCGQRVYGDVHTCVTDDSCVICHQHHDTTACPSPASLDLTARGPIDMHTIREAPLLVRIRELEAELADLRGLVEDLFDNGLAWDPEIWARIKSAACKGKGGAGYRERNKALEAENKLEAALESNRRAQKVSPETMDLTFKGRADAEHAECIRELLEHHSALIGELALMVRDLANTLAGDPPLTEVVSGERAAGDPRGKP